MDLFHSVSSRGDVVLNERAKSLLYKIHCDQGALAYSSDGKTRPLSECVINDVEFIGGLWRIQDKFEHEIQMVRGREFVLLEKLNRIEKNRFEFYRAAPVDRNCYGRFMISGFERIVAKYETDNQTYWAYGDTIEQVRAFLGIRLYDEFSDLIHSVACSKKLNQKQK